MCSVELFLFVFQKNHRVAERLFLVISDFTRFKVKNHWKAVFSVCCLFINNTLCHFKFLSNISKLNLYFDFWMVINQVQQVLFNSHSPRGMTQYEKETGRHVHTLLMWCLHCGDVCCALVWRTYARVCVAARQYINTLCVFTVHTQSFFLFLSLKASSSSRFKTQTLSCIFTATRVNHQCWLCSFSCLPCS